ncbi:MAG: rhodanese-like domain-containing protein [Planctomycetota bacterium JB042]
MAEFRRTVAEACLVGVLLLLVALAANVAYPDGLELGRDYFRPDVRPPAGDTPTTASTAPPSETPDARPDAAPEGTPPSGDPGAASAPTDEEIAKVEARIRAEGLQTISHAEVVALFEDPIYSDGAYVFVDARNDAHFEAGHIPGAYQFDHFRMERYVNEVVPACQGALRVVVYCYGRDCTDSEIAAKHLRNFGVDPSILAVYVPGIQGWCADGRQVEKGPRGSGEIGACDA